MRVLISTASRAMVAGAWLALGVITAVACRGEQTAAPAAVRAPETRGAPPEGRPEAEGAGRERAAYVIVDLESGRIVRQWRAEALGPAPPGSIIKIATLAAAVQAGVVDAHTRITCRRRMVVDGRAYECVHPELGRPLDPVDALAHSCNYFFASIVRRLTREGLAAALIGLGLPPPAPGAPLTAAALGLAGIDVAPRALLEALARVARAAPGGTSIVARDLIVKGVTGAATYGTAAAFGAAGVDVLAKTGTVVTPDGTVQGMVVAITTSTPRLGIALVAPGAAGADAAAIAARHMAGTLLDRGPSIRVGAAGQEGTYALRTMPLERYVAGVVAGEAAPRTPSAALEALAITARTYALVNRGRHQSEGFDLCDLTHCQVVRASTAETERVALRTAGRVATRQGKLAEVFYTGCCGGAPEQAGDVWGHDAAGTTHRASDPDAACRVPRRWTADLTRSDLERALAGSGWRGELRTLDVAERGGGGRVRALQVDGLVPPTIGGEAFRMAVGRALGWHLIKSTVFDVERSGSGYRFTGAGIGHGVGLCLAGAAALAANGRDARTILQVYFPDMTVRSWHDISGVAPRGAAGTGSGSRTRVHLLISVDAEAERPRLTRLIEEAIGRTSGRAGISAPADVWITFHPTVESYVRATGRPWWTAGATDGPRVQLLPFRTLQARGMLDRVIAHELAHVVITSHLEDPPLWVSEGAAMHITGEELVDRRHTQGDDADGSCPADAEFVHARSAEALQQAYRRALGCFQRELAAGKSWTQMR